MLQQRNAFSIVARHAQTRPDAPALTGNGRSWSYAQLAEQAECIAGALTKLSPQPGSRVAVVADNHAITCLVYLAAARAGMIVSLVNSLFKVQELTLVFAKLAPQIVIVDAAHRGMVESALEQAAVAASIAPLESVEAWSANPPLQAPLPVDQECFEISWTSGTTSSPKGVMLTHDTAIYRAECEIALFELTHADAAAVITPLFHQSGIRNTVLVMWVCGGHAVVLHRFDVKTFWSDIGAQRISYLCMVETILLMLDRQPPCEEERNNPLRTVLAAGAVDVIRRCESRFGFRVVQVWGMTEAGVAAGVPCSMQIDAVNELRSWGKGAFLAGWPVSTDTEIRLVTDGKIVTRAGETGEIQLRSRMLFSSYYEEPQATRTAFDGEWLKTGDLGMFGPGQALYFVDRLKDVIRRGGENIASKQVEEVLLTHPRIRRAAVIPVPDPLFMQEVKAVLVTDGELCAEEVWNWCSDRLARYKVPRYIQFMDALPINGSGRVQKQALITALGDSNNVVFDRRATTKETA